MDQVHAPTAGHGGHCAAEEYVYRDAQAFMQGPIPEPCHDRGEQYGHQQSERKVRH